MRCRKVRENLSAYLDRALPAVMQKRIAAHLEACTECHNALDQLQELLGTLLTGLPAQPLPDELELTAQLLARAQDRLEQLRIIEQRKAGGQHRVVDQRKAIDQRKTDRVIPSWSLLRWWVMETPAMRLAALVILTIGLTAGFLLGRSTSPVPARVAFSASSAGQKRQPDPMALYGFDSLFSDAAGSVEHAYLTLTFSRSSARKEG